MGGFADGLDDVPEVLHELDVVVVGEFSEAEPRSLVDVEVRLAQPPLPSEPGALLLQREEVLAEGKLGVSPERRVRLARLRFHKLRC